MLWSNTFDSCSVQLCAEHFPYFPHLVTPTPVSKWFTSLVFPELDWCCCREEGPRAMRCSSNKNSDAQADPPWTHWVCSSRKHLLWGSTSRQEQFSWRTQQDADSWNVLSNLWGTQLCATRSCFSQPLPNTLSTLKTPFTASHVHTCFIWTSQRKCKVWELQWLWPFTFISFLSFSEFYFCEKFIREKFG